MKMNNVFLTGRITEMTGIKDKGSGIYALAYIDVIGGLPLTLVFKVNLAVNLTKNVKVGDKIFVSGSVIKSTLSKNVFIMVHEFELLDFYDFSGRDDINIEL